MKTAQIIIVALFLSGCTQKNKIKSSDEFSTKLVFENNKVFEALLSNDMKIKIEENTFNTNSKIILRYISINRLEDFVREKLTTQTVDGRDLRTYGMINIKFYDQNGMELIPQKPYSIISRKINGSNKVDIFYGTRNDKGNVVWNEIPQKKWKIFFYPNSYSKQFGGDDFYVDSNSSFCDYLNAHFENQLFEDSLKYTIHLLQKKDSTIEYTKFTRRYGINKKLEKEIKQFTQNLKVSNYDNDGQTIWSILIGSCNKNDYTEYRDSIIKVIGMSNKRDFTPYQDSLVNEGRVVITTLRIGWFNFDEYINTPNAYLTVKSNATLRLASEKANRYVVPYSVEGDINKFRVSLETEDETMTLLKVENGEITYYKKIKVVRGKTVTSTW